MKDEFILTLLDKFDSSSAVTLHIKEGETELLLKKEGAYKAEVQVTETPSFYANQPSFSQVAQSQSSALAAPENTVAPQTQNQQSVSSTSDIVKSPLVGTFYRSPSPDSPSYVEVGTKVKKGQPICILEAMKMMNTLEAEFDCVIEKILVDNGDLVEFDQHIFQVTKV